MAVNTFGWKRREIVVLPQDHKATLTDTHFCPTQQLQDQSQIGMYLSSGLSRMRSEGYCNLYVSVRLSVPALTALAYVCTCNQRYSRVSRRLFTCGFSKKNFRSKVMA